MFSAHHSTKQIIVSVSDRDHNSGGGACGGNEGNDESDNSDD